MTACVNRKHTKKVAAVVTASLVGALSLGVAPVAAMAEEAGIELQAASKQEVIDAAKITAAMTTNRKDVTIKEDGSLEVVASAEGIRGVYPTELTIAGQTITLTEQDYEDGDYTVFFTDAAGIVMPHAVGDYTGHLRFNTGDYAGCTKEFTFRIKPAAIGEVTVVDATGEDFVYDSTDQRDRATILVDGKMIDDDDFFVEFDVEGGNTTDGLSSPVENAGSYVLKLTGKPGTIYAGSTSYAQFSVAQLDLAKADIVIDDMLVNDLKQYPFGTAQPTIETVNGKTAVIPELQAIFKSSTTQSVDMPGVYTYTVSELGNNPNIINSKDVSFNAVEELLNAGDFFYSQGVVQPGGYNLDGRRESFNTALLKAVHNGESLEGIIVTVTDADGNTVDATELTAPGHYNVTVSVDVDFYDFKLGGKISFPVDIIGGVVRSADVIFSYNGVIGGDSANDTFDGSNLLENLGVVVMDDLGIELTEGEDYTVTATDANGNELTEITDAGEYKIVVSSATYDMPAEVDRTFTLTVAPIDVTNVRVSNLRQLGDDRAFFPFTGSDIAVELEYSADNGDTWAALPADTYELVIRYSDVFSTNHNDYDVVEAINEVGFYEIYVHQAEGVSNWLIGDGATRGFIGIENAVTRGDDTNDHTVWVTDAKLFADVPNNQWYTEVIWDAVNLGYMGGYAGSDLFGTNHTITRGQVACVLFNMAGGEPVYTEEWFNENIGTTSSFTDVDENEFYARPIEWAVKAGVVNGYGDGTFKPNQAITREEMAAMLANYAKVTGDYVAADTDEVLASMPDGDQVSDWAEDVVAWAVENEVMGNGGFIAPVNPITRAEVAAMAVNYQPDGSFTSPLDITWIR